MTMLRVTLDIIFLLCGLLVLAPALYLLVVTLAGFFSRAVVEGSKPSCRIAVIIPAHNESLLLERTIKSVMESDYPRELFDIIVIADNCTDDTAAIAEKAGAACLERYDEENRGKGHALGWAFERIRNERPGRYGAYLVIDADSLVSKNLLRRVNDHISSGASALTCFHMVGGAEGTAEAGTPALEIVRMGFTLRNLRNAGLSALGGSAPFLGSGMCLSADLVERLGWSSFSLAEDREQWASLYARGYDVDYLPDAHVYSEMPGRVGDLRNPRARWDVGQFDVIRRFHGAFRSRLLRDRSLGALLTFFELITPPFTILFFLIILGAASSLLMRHSLGVLTVSLWLLDLGIMAASVLAGLVRMRASTRTYVNLFIYPFFLIPWRVFNLVRGAMSKKEWRRTERGAKAGASPVRGEKRITRVLHVSATSTGGVGLNLLLLARHMNREAFDLTFALPEDSHFFKEIEATGVRVKRLSISRSPLKAVNLKGYREIKALLRSGRYDLVHSHTSVGGYLGRLAAHSMGVPAIWSIHGWAFNYPRGSRLYRKALYMLERWIDRYTRHYVAVCAKMRDIGVENGLCQEDKVTVIYHGIDAAAINRGAVDLRSDLKIGQERPVVGAVGRFEEQKGLDTFVRAARLIKDRFRGVKFLLVGDGPLRPEIEEQIGVEGLTADFILTGWTTRVADYMKTMDIFCLPSRWEAMPLIVLEAMAMGKPIVATEVGGVGEVLRDEGADFLLRPDDAEGLAEAVLVLLGDRAKREALGTANREKIKTTYTLERMIRRYERLYTDLLT